MKILKPLLMLTFFTAFLLYINSCKTPDFAVEDVMDTTFYDYPDETVEFTLREFSGKGYRTRFVNIHCTATKEGVDLGAQWFLNFFRFDRGWSKPGYNILILLDGTIEVLVPFDYNGYTSQNEVSNGVYGENRWSINIAYVGGVDSRLRAKDTRTEAQKRAMDGLLQTLKCQMPDIIILGHRDHEGVAKACPSFDVESEYGYLNGIVNKTELFDYYNDSLHTPIDTLLPTDQ